MYVRNPYSVYDFTESRKRDLAPQRSFPAFSGYLAQADAYGGYDGIVTPSGTVNINQKDAIIEVACNGRNARRYWHKAIDQDHAARAVNVLAVITSSHHPNSTPPLGIHVSVADE